VADFSARLTLGNKSYPGRVENLSDDGICLLVPPSLPPLHSCMGSECSIEFSHPSGEKMNINCRVKYMYKTPPHGITNSMIMEVSDPSVQYKKLLKSL